MKKKFAIGLQLKGKDESSPVRRGIRKVGKVAAVAKSKIKGLAGSFGGLGTAITAFATGYAVKKGLDYITSFAESADEIAKLSRQVNVSTSALQEWRYAAGLAGVGGEMFDKAATQLNRRLGEMRVGVGETATFMKAVAPDVFLQLTSAKDTDEAIGIAVRAMEKIKDPAKRAVLASKLFGEELGGRMTRFAEMGSKGIAEAREEARKFGLVTENSAKEAEAFNDDVARLKASFGGLKTAIGSELLPVLRPMVKEFGKWLQTNKGKVASRITSAVKAIGKWLRDVDWKAIGKGIGSFLDSVGKVIDGLGGVKSLLIGIGLMKFGSLILSIGKIGTAFSALSAGPIGLVLAGIAAMGLGLKKTLDRMDDISRRRKRDREWRKRMNAEADRKTEEAVSRAGLLPKGVESRKTALPDGKVKIISGKQVGRLFGDLTHAQSMRDFANGRLTASEFGGVEKRYTDFRKSPFALPPSKIELDINLNGAARGVEVGAPKVQGPNAPVVKSKVGKRLVGAPAGG